MPDNNVFKRVNEAFSSHNAWITYGGFQRVKIKDAKVEPSGRVEPLYRPNPDVRKNNAYRAHGWFYPHLHAFYAWLFKLIKLEDFVTTTVPGFEGKLFPFANDQAMVYPMMEMATWKHIFKFKERIYFGTIPEKRGEDKKVDWRPTVDACVKEVTRGRKYAPVEKPISRNLEKFYTSKASLVVFCSKMPTFDYLDGVQNLKGIKNIVFIFEELSDEDKELISNFKLMYEKVLFFDNGTKEGKDALQQFLKRSAAEHIIFSDTDHIFDKPIHIGKSIYLLEKSYAYAFYFDRCLKKYPANIHETRLEDSAYFWKFTFGQEEWNKVHTTANVLYRKKDVQGCLANLCKNGFRALNEWKSGSVSSGKIGLFYQ